MPQKFFTSNQQGDIITRMTSDISSVQSVIANTMSSILQQYLHNNCHFRCPFQKNWVLAIVGVSLVPLLSVPTINVGKRRWKFTKEAQEQTDKINTILNETLSVSGQQLTKIFTREERDLKIIPIQTANVCVLQ